MAAGTELLEERTERFAIAVLQLIDRFPHSEPAANIKRQLAKSAPSVPANYRASRRSRSHAEFTARIAVVAEESDESLFWLTLAARLKLGTSDAQALVQEASELTAIFSAMVGTARRNSRRGTYAERDKRKQR